MADFFQQGPQLQNQYEADIALQECLLRKIPESVLQQIEPDLRNFGQRVVNDIWQMGLHAEAQEPKLVQFDPWGRRIDEIIVSDAWKQLDAVSAEEGLVAIGYERKFGAFSRLYQFAKLYLFDMSSAVYTCPLAMTDGAARLIEMNSEELKQHAFTHLTSRDPQKFWTSGQWMTERTGGSDVRGTQTVAQLQSDGSYTLSGDKWFTSATTSQMAITLAYIAGQQSLSLFYLEIRNPEGRLNNILIHRLKDKLGTKALPTAELRLENTPAKLIGKPGKGVKTISTILNITRIYNATSCVAAMRRGISLAQDYATKREAFGKKIIDHPLHRETLSRLQVEYEGALHLVFYIIAIMGKEECGEATETEITLSRILTPIAKLYTAKQAIRVISEVLECFGGAGYIEDTGIPKMLRNIQVCAIWEGTTNILSLDVLRAIHKDQALLPLLEEMRLILASIYHPDLKKSGQKVVDAIEKLSRTFPAIARDENFVQLAARDFAFSLARTFIACLLLQQAQWSFDTLQSPRASYIARRWCQQDLMLLPDPKEEQLYTEDILWFPKR